MSAWLTADRMAGIVPVPRQAATSAAVDERQVSERSCKRLSGRLPSLAVVIGVGNAPATVDVVATATPATFTGGGGLGDIIVNEPTYGTAGVIAGSLTITLLAFRVDGVLAQP